MGTKPLNPVTERLREFTAHLEQPVRTNPERAHVLGEAIHHASLDDIELEMDELCEQFATGDLRLSAVELASLASRYQQLVAFFPRYAEVMNRRERFIDVLAAGAREQPTDGDWRVQSDPQFAHSYATAIDEFRASAVQFSDSLSDTLRRREG